MGNQIFWISSYPKSGNTLIRSILTALFFTDDGKFELEVSGRGGTYFEPVLEHFEQNRQFTSLIYFTDGEAWTDMKPRKPVLWVLSERSDFNDSLPGRQIRLEI